jgi:gluconate kinase
MNESSGQSGCGKTSLCNLLRDNLGFCHFDGDVWSCGGDPVAYSGVPTKEMVEKFSGTDLKRHYDHIIENGFGRLFRGEKPELSHWLPFHTLMAEAVLEVWSKESKSLAVSYAVYDPDLRDYLKSKLPQVEFLILNDVAQQAVERKVQQVVAAVKEQNVTMSAFLSKFTSDYAGLSDEDCVRLLREKCGVTQTGFTPAREGIETGIDVENGMSLQDVFDKTRSLLKL